MRGAAVRVGVTASVAAPARLTFAPPRSFACAVGELVRFAPNLRFHERLCRCKLSIESALKAATGVEAMASELRASGRSVQSTLHETAKHTQGDRDPLLNGIGRAYLRSLHLPR